MYTMGNTENVCFISKQYKLSSLIIPDRMAPLVQYTTHIWSECLPLSVNSPTTVVGTGAEVEDSYEMDSLSTVYTVLLVTLSTAIGGRWVKSVQLVI